MEKHQKDIRKQRETLDKFECKTVKGKNWAWLRHIPHLCRTEQQEKRKLDHPKEGKRRTQKREEQPNSPIKTKLQYEH